MSATVFLAIASCVSSPPAPEEKPLPEPIPEPVEILPVEEPVVEEVVEEVFEVSKEVYTKTFDEIEALILELNSVISRRQFDRWTTYLSGSYIQTYNSGEKLSEINEFPQMKENGIVLTRLKDYFDWVVVPSRSKAVLDEIVFVGETRVIAYTMFESKRAKLYELERIDKIWKITVW